MPQNVQAALLDELERDVKKLRDHGGSRFVGVDADPDVARHVANGGSLVPGSGGVPYGSKSVADYAGDERMGGRLASHGQGGGGSLAKSIIDVAQHRTENLQPAYAAKALAEATDAAGGFLLVPEIANTVLMLIRNRVAVSKMPVTHVQPTSKQYVLPGLASGASASWLTENSAIPASSETFQIAATMQPRPLGSLVAVSNRLLADAVASNPSSAGSAEQVIQSDIADLMATTMDAGLLQGDAAGPGPHGILRTTGTTPLPAGTIGTNGSQITYGLLVAIVGALQQQSLPFSSPGWIFSGRTLTSLMTLTNSIGEPLLSSAGLLTVDPTGTTGRLLGYPFAVTNAVPNNQTFGTANNASTIIFASDWSELFVGDWQLFAIDSSQEASYTPDGGTTWVSAYQNQQTIVRAVLWADMAIRRPVAFVLAGGILP